MTTLAQIASLALSAAAAAAGALLARALGRRKLAREAGRRVESERMLAMLSALQPGVWDVDELRALVAERFGRWLCASTPGELAALETWVSPARLQEARSRRTRPAPVTASRVAFVHVEEGDSGDRVVARVSYRQGARARLAYATFRHVDGQGWLLMETGSHLPHGLGAPRSVRCRMVGEPPEIPGANPLR